MLKSMFIYVLFYSKYIIQHRIESLEKVFLKFNKEVYFRKYGYIIYTLFFILKISFECIIYLGISYFLSQYLNSFEAWIMYSLYFVGIIGIINGISLTKRVLSPVDKNILYLLPYSNRNLYLYTWLLKFSVHNVNSILQSIILGISIYIMFGNVNYFILLLIGLLICSIMVSYIVTLYICVFYVKCIQTGYKIAAFITSIFKGLMIYICTYFIANWIVHWLISVEDIRQISTWKNLIAVFFKQIKIYIFELNIKELVYSNSFNNIIFTAVTILVVVVGSIHYLLAGKWYRSQWETPFKGDYSDWILVLNKFFNKFVKSPLLKVQIQNFFNSRIQLSHHYSYFFGHYFNYAFIALSSIVATLPNTGSVDIVKFVLIYIIFNSISKDAYETITLFPGLLRFDSDSGILRLYRMSNVSFSKLYHSKIQFQRFLGSVEMFCIVIICFCIIKPSLQETFFISCVITLNYCITPHITTLSTYMFPHLHNQHYSEMEDYVETEFVIDKVAYQFRQIIFFCTATPFLMLVFLEINTDWMYLIIGSLFVIISFVSLKLIKNIIKKAESKLNQMDM
ncbi:MULTISPECIES: hypothetical protein [Bacillus cereus group]|uniref:hypothetical protein n=1 Tax=Bacillus cereus group TaxID=86661 RepID=UPI00065D6B99|nr:MULTISPECIES: hypothetical protein [Bacillus cereus group]KMN68148.1 hypothetical protein VK96_22085 [Bacillus cereus]MED3614507.1 hypothetical protein [Bacillus wiedmannii]